MEYPIEFFVSYKDNPTNRKWVETFVAEISYYMGASIGDDKIYYAPKKASFKFFEDDIFENLGKTRILIAIYTKDYFDDDSYGLKEMAYMYHRYLLFKHYYPENISPIIAICLGKPMFFEKKSEITLEDFSNTNYLMENSGVDRATKNLLRKKTRELCDKIMSRFSDYPGCVVEFYNKANYIGYEKHIESLRGIYNTKLYKNYPPPSMI